MIQPVVINLIGGPLDGGKITKHATPGAVFPTPYKSGDKEFHAFYKLTGFDTDTGEWNARYMNRVEAIR